MEHIIKTNSHNQMVDITDIIRQVVRESGIVDGIALVFIPHTTAGVTINENADPDVVHDILLGFDKVSPHRSEYRHMEGNSDAHIKASLMGSSCIVIIERGKLKLGTWQGIYFCEFDGPRTRKVYIKLIEG